LIYKEYTIDVFVPHILATVVPTIILELHIGTVPYFKNIYDNFVVHCFVRYRIFFPFEVHTKYFMGLMIDGCADTYILTHVVVDGVRLHL
jgi:hypothetical protein